MPSGYTDRLFKENQSLPDFVWSCARAFGALVTMRDKSQESPTPKEFLPSDYHKKALEEAKLKYNQLSGMSFGEAKEWGRREKEKQIKLYKEWQKGDEAEKRIVCYQSMLDKLENWEPPTVDHIGLKKFMIEQLVDSIKFDGPSSYYIEKIGKYEVLLAEQVYEEVLGETECSIQYHIKEWEDEVKRVKIRNRWMKDLQESVGMPSNFCEKSE